MKRKFLFTIAIVSAVAGSAMATVVLPTGVSEYRIIFATSGTYLATSTDIAWYNAQAASQAATDATLNGLGAQWYCVGSTDTVNARDNITPGIAWNAENIPIYNTQGSRVATNIADLFDGDDLHHYIYYDQSGNASSDSLAWTGSNSDGTAHFCALGNTNTIYGCVSDTTSTWINAGYIDSFMPHRLYSISSPVPEPATVCLLGFGGLALLRRSMRRLHS